MTTTESPRVPRWRIAAAAAVLGGLVFFGVRLTPYYIHNYRLQQFVETVTQRVENREKSDDLLRTWVLERAADLQLPVKADNVLVKRSPEGLRIEIRYVVRVDMPVYTVDLHFYPGAGAR